MYLEIDFQIGICKQNFSTKANQGHMIVKVFKMGFKTVRKILYGNFIDGVTIFSAPSVKFPNEFFQLKHQWRLKTKNRYFIKIREISWSFHSLSKEKKSEFEIEFLV